MSHTVDDGKVTATRWNFDLEFEWKIDNFDNMMELSEDDKNIPLILRSMNFSSNYMPDIEWYLMLNLNGATDNGQQYISIYLNYNAELEAKSIFVVVNNEKRMVANVRGIECNKRGHVYRRFISRSYVRNPKNGVLDNGKLTILCKIKWKSYEIGKDQDYISSDLELNDYEALLDDGEYSDVTLVSEGKSIKAHKCILAKKSAVFAAMFGIEMKEKRESIVEICDVNYDVLLELLRFVYAGKVNNIDNLAGELAIAADKYALNHLKDTCEEVMIKNLNPDNVIVYLQAADKICMGLLRKKAIDFIVTNSIHVKNKQEFNLLSRDIIWEIFRCMARRIQIQLHSQQR